MLVWQQVCLSQIAAPPLSRQEHRSQTPPEVLAEPHHPAYRSHVISTLLFIALAAVGVLVFGWIWYPSHMATRGRTRRSMVRSESERHPAELNSTLPSVSVILATREPTPRIVARLADLLTSNYPKDRLEIVVALDGAHADRLEELQQTLGSAARVCTPGTPGKAAALNAGVEAARSDLLLFIDSAQTFAPDVIGSLVQQLSNPAWGAATATLAPNSGDPLMDRYWQRELDIRLGQMQEHSVICVTGCAYLMQRRFWSPMPAGLICDDLWSTYSVIVGGARVALVPEAQVVDPRRFTREQEFSRRLRTTTGMLQFIRWFPGILSPGKNPMFWHFTLHKLIRPATPILLAIAAICVLAAVTWYDPRAGLILLLLGAVLFILPWLLSRLAPAPIARPSATILFAQRLLLMPLSAMGRALRSDWDIWRPHS